MDVAARTWRLRANGAAFEAGLSLSGLNYALVPMRREFGS
jgi:hypothetical protein